MQKRLSTRRARQNIARPIFNRKGQDLSIGTLILIVLGIIVLVLLILGFSMGWGNLWDKINIFGGGSSISDVTTACNLAATQNNKYSFCSDFKKIKVNNQVEYINCEDARVNPSLETKLTCDPAAVTSAVSSFCGTLDEKDRLKIKVYGKYCPTLTPEQILAAFTAECQAKTGQVMDTTACVGPSLTLITLASTVQQPTGKVCCKSATP